MLLGLHNHQPNMYSYYTIFFLISFLFSSPCLAARPPPTYTAEPVTIPTMKNHSHPWFEFEKFLDAGRGSKVKGISSLKEYFHHFGYIKEQDMNFTDMFDARMEHALTKYQTRLGLSVTGTLDSETLSQIMSPRCGVSDTSNMLHATNRYAYFTGQPRWTRSIPMTLTYAFSPVNLITSLSMPDIRDAFKRSFNHWASVVPISFIQTDDYALADIQIGFYYGDHGDGEAFDGVLGVLAHAFSPESGKFHLDAAETWAVDFHLEKSKVAVDLESIATHEIGHLLGLGHTSVKEAVMYPTLKPREKRVDLKLDDIKAIQALYGSNPNFNLGTISESDILLNYAIDLRAISTRWFNLMLLGMLWLCM